MLGDFDQSTAKPTRKPAPSQSHRHWPCAVAALGLALSAALSTQPLPAQARAGHETTAARPMVATQQTWSAQPAAVASAPSLSASYVVTINVDSSFAYLAPDWNSPLVGRLIKWETLNAVGRNTNGEWLQVDYGNSLVWVHRTTVRFPGDLNGNDNAVMQGLPITEAAGALSPSRIRMLAVGVPYISARARQLYRQAVASGRDPLLFTVAGDCNSESPVYLGRFAGGGFNLAANGFSSLDKTAKKFAASFSRHSLAVDGGHNAASVMDPLFANGKQCEANESPLECELRASNASIVFIGLGTGDTFTWQDFEGNYRRILDTALARNVLPVLVTKADDLESTQGGAPRGTINAIIRSLGAEYQLPVMDFASAARRLPDQGLAEEGKEVNGQGVVYAAASRFHLNGYGMDMRMVLTLMTLNAIAAR